MTATDRAVLEQLRTLAVWLVLVNDGSIPAEPMPGEDVADNLRVLLADHERLSREVERLRASALCLVNEYRSHGGKGTHQECMPGCGCALPAQVTLLEAEVRAAHANGTACLLREEPARACTASHEKGRTTCEHCAPGNYR